MKIAANFIDHLLQRIYIFMINNIMFQLRLLAHGCTLLRMLSIRHFRCSFLSIPLVVYPYIFRRRCIPIFSHPSTIKVNALYCCSSSPPIIGCPHPEATAALTLLLITPNIGALTSCNFSRVALCRLSRLSNWQTNIPKYNRVGFSSGFLIIFRLDRKSRKPSRFNSSGTTGDITA